MCGAASHLSCCRGRPAPHYLPRRRRVRDEANILEGITSHPLFLAIVASEALLQYAIVQYGGEAFSTTPLTPAQWALCAGLGAGSLLVRAGLRGVKVGGGQGGGGGPAAGATAGAPTAHGAVVPTTAGTGLGK